MNTIRIESDRVKLAITVLGYERPSSTEFYDGNWLCCEMRLKTIHLNITTNINLATFELQQLCDDLDGLVSGRLTQVEFVPMERGVVLSFRSNLRMAIIATILVEIVGEPNMSLSLETETDLGRMYLLIEDLRSAISVFPTRNN